MNQWLLRDGGGSIGEEELGKVMKTFGWDPKEEELKVHVEVDIMEIWSANLCRAPQLDPGNGLCHWSRRRWRHQLQRIRLADDQVRQKKWALAISFPREFKDSEIEDEIREAFKVFDKEGNGFVKTAGWSELQLSRSHLIDRVLIFQSWRKSCKQWETCFL